MCAYYKAAAATTTTLSIDIMLTTSSAVEKLHTSHACDIILFPRQVVGVVGVGLYVRRKPSASALRVIAFFHYFIYPCSILFFFD